MIIDGRIQRLRYQTSDCTVRMLPIFVLKLSVFPHIFLSIDLSKKGKWCGQSMDLLEILLPESKGPSSERKYVEYTGHDLTQDKIPVTFQTAYHKQLHYIACMHNLEHRNFKPLVKDSFMVGSTANVPFLKYAPSPCRPLKNPTNTFIPIEGVPDLDNTWANKDNSSMTRASIVIRS